MSLLFLVILRSHAISVVFKQFFKKIELETIFKNTGQGKVRRGRGGGGEGVQPLAPNLNPLLEKKRPEVRLKT